MRWETILEEGVPHSWRPVVLSEGPDSGDLSSLSEGSHACQKPGQHPTTLTLSQPQSFSLSASTQPLRGTILVPRPGINPRPLQCNVES